VNQRCAREQADVGELIRAGHPEQFGLRLGAQDWLKEEAFLYGETHDEEEGRSAG
jgi:hypothetical protein